MRLRASGIAVGFLAVAPEASAAITLILAVEVSSTILFRMKMWRRGLTVVRERAFGNVSARGLMSKGV